MNEPAERHGDGQQDLPSSTRAIYAIFDYVAAHRLRIAWAAVALAAVGLALSGFHVVKKEEEALRTRFGRVVEENIGPGLHYRIPVIERAWVRPVHRIAEHMVSSRRNGQEVFTVLSGDLNLLEVSVAVQYRIDNLRNFLFATPDPVVVLTQLLREEIVSDLGQNFIDLIVSLNRNIIQDHLFEEVVELLEERDIGLELVALNIVDVRPIDETRAAFRDVTDAISERNEAISNANLRSERMLARSRGQAEAVVREAQAKAHERVAQAGGNAEAFLALLAEYRQEPEQVAITRYWQRMRTIFSDASLAAVNPASDSVIDINMIDGVAGVPPMSVLAAAPPSPGLAPTRPLTSFTAPETAPRHGETEAADRLLSQGAFHDRFTERDDLLAARPRSLIFETPSIFSHVEVEPSGAIAAQQQVVRPMVDTLAAEASGDAPDTQPQSAVSASPAGADAAPPEQAASAGASSAAPPEQGTAEASSASAAE